MKKVMTLSLLLALALPAFAQQDYTPIKVESQRRIKGSKTIYAEWVSNNTRIIDNMHGFTPKGAPPVNAYGSLVDKKVKATGFFRTEKIDGRWWIVDPLGHCQLQRGVTSTRPDDSPNAEKAFAEKFGTIDKWVEATAEEYHKIGFYGFGSWSEDEAVMAYNARSEQKLFHVPCLNFMSSYGHKRGGMYKKTGHAGYPDEVIFVFDPQFEAFCDEHAREKTRVFREDPSLVGYFSDNEMPLGKNNLECYLKIKNPQDPGRLAAEAFVRSKGVQPGGELTDAMKLEFAGIVAEKYYSIVSKALKKYDPNHLYMGSRLFASNKFERAILEAAARYCDVISMNYYGEWTPNRRFLQNLQSWVDKPFIVTEFYTKAMDTGLTNVIGAGWRVRTQQDRGYAYQHFCLALLESKQCVGWHFYRYMDDDPTVDPAIDSNRGIVSTYYEYYRPFTALMKQLNDNVYGLVEYFDSRLASGE